MNKPTGPVGVDIAQMRSEIAQITGQLPTSFNRRYLQIRLAALRRDPPKTKTKDRAVPLTISLGSKYRKLVEHMADEGEVSVSMLARKAFDLYAKQHGFGAELAKLVD